MLISTAGVSYMFFEWRCGPPRQSKRVGVFTYFLEQVHVAEVCFVHEQVVRSFSVCSPLGGCIMRIRLISGDQFLYKLCREVLLGFRDREWDFGIVPSYEHAVHADLFLWDLQ